MASTFTVRSGVVTSGIVLTCAPRGRPFVRVGEPGRGRKQVDSPLPPGAVVEGRTPDGTTPCRFSYQSGQVYAPGYGPAVSKCGSCGCRLEVGQPATHGDEVVPGLPGTMVAAPVSGDAAGTSAVVLVADHSGYRGGWHLRAARTEAEWDEIVTLDGSADATAAFREHYPEQPHGCRVIAEGCCAQGAAGHMGGGPEYLLILADGQAVEVVRAGRLYGSPAVVRLTNTGSVVTAADPRKDAEARRAAGAW